VTRFEPTIRGALVLSLLLATLASSPACSQSRRVPLSYEQPGLDNVGTLEWRGGLELSSDDHRFGGVSALDVSDDGRMLTALTDRGDWMRFALDYDVRGHLAAARLVILEPLIGSDARPLSERSERDAESLARLTDGGLVVAFERHHRLLRYPAAEPPFSLPPMQLTTPAELRRSTGNSGIEALTEYRPGRLLALSEKTRLEDGSLLGWTGNGRSWRPLRYRSFGDFRPTGATTLPGGGVLLLERSFSVFGGFAARLVRLDPEAIDRAAADLAVLLEGHEVARLEPPVNIDNFEAIAARRDAGGVTLVYLMSDDNFFALQRTLLLVFALREEPAAEPHG
jgi:hypothetical protein